ncbi:MAG: hypothetical protein CVU38_02180, partial [Chloroflexi bacterium HGW-Chloroflexi-1]
RYLEPDVTAPGVNILSAGYGDGTGLAQHMGFGQASGTSMAAPHVAGAAALLKQMHPNWTPTQIKSALMTTSVTDVWLDTAQTVPASVLDMGAGRIDLTRAGDPGLTFDDPSLSFGSHMAGSTATLVVTATDIRAAGAARTYALSAMADAGITVTVNSPSLTFGGGESKTFKVTVDTTGAAPGDYGGMIHVDYDSHMNHLPLWVRVEAAPEAKVLLIDNDFSDLLGYPDYSGFYMDALDNLGVPYDYYNADLHFANSQTLPSAAELAAYDVIVYWTGDNFYDNGSFTVATPLTEIDMQVLTDWQFNGGRLFASGQDLASAWDALDISGTGYFLYAGNLGAGYLQDSIFDPAGDGLLPPVPAVIGQPGSPISGVALDISGSAPITDVVDGEEIIVGWQDGAANQYYVDEIEIAPYGDVEAPETVKPILAAIDGYGLQAGYVGATRAASPRLEHPAQFPYRSIYLSFGFESINNNTGYNTREETMAAVLKWLTDEVAVTVTGPGVVADPNDVAVFETSLTSSVAAALASCRLDFGDGSAFAEGLPGGTAFAYVYGAVGAYTVRAECTDSLGFSAIGETTVDVQQGYTTPVTETFLASGDTFIAQGLPADNYGRWAFLYVGAKDALRSLVQFDFSAINPAYPVDQATLWVYVDAFSGADKAAEYRLDSSDYWFAEFGPHVQVTYRTP